MKSLNKLTREKCPFCTGKLFHSLLAFDDVSIVRCSCGYVFMNPYLCEEGSQAIFSSDYTQIFPWLKGYALEHQTKNARIFGVYKEALVFAEEKLGFAGKVLDIGCGMGHFLEIAEQRGWVPSGIDFTETKLKADIHFGKIFDAPWKEESFDLITMWDYWEHVENPLAVLRKARQLLKPAGILIIACPNYDSFLFRLANVLHRVSGRRFLRALRMLYPPTHLSYFYPSFVAGVAGEEGFEKMQMTSDETDLTRISIHPILKGPLQFFFYISRLFGMSNRFTLYLRKS